MFHKPDAARLLVIAALFGSTALMAQTTRVNSGGWPARFTDSQGVAWETDRYWTGGYVAYWFNANSVSELYRTARRGAKITYRIPVAAGTYTVTLKFAEFQALRAGDRIMEIVANDETKVANFDILAESATGMVDKRFEVTVSESPLVLVIRDAKPASVPNYHEATISALEVVPRGTTVPVPVTVAPQQVTLGPGQSTSFTATGASGVQWTVTGLGTIDASGLYRAPSTISASSVATVNATSAGVVLASARVDLKPPIAVAVNPTTASVVSLQTAQFTASVTGTTDTRVTWTASSGSISVNGLFTAPNVTVTTPVTITARSVVDSTASGTAQVTVNAVSSPTVIPFQEANGLVSLEAESGTLMNRAQSWVARNTQAGFSGVGYLSGEPDSGQSYTANYVMTAPEAQFTVNFAAAGTYHIWVRAWAPSVAGDSVIVGLNGVPNAAGEAITNFPTAPPVWAWSSTRMDGAGRATVTVPSAGTHVLNLYMREDGVLVDKVVLTRDANFVASGSGPAESVRGTTAPPQSTLTVSPGSLSFSLTSTAAQNVAVSATGAALQWTASKDASWISLGTTAGSTPGTLVVSADSSGLSAGVYQGRVTVSAGSGSQQVAVTLTVTASNPTPPPPATGPQYYVTTSGTASGDGSISRPWDLETALAKTTIPPGSTIWVRGGTYGHGGLDDFPVRLQGTATAPVIVRAYPGERATINGWVPVYSSYVWIWGFEIMNSSTNRTASGSILDGLDIYNSTGVKAINNVIHDRSGGGIGMWEGAVNAEAYGNVIYNNGHAGDTRGYYHGFYTQNKDGKKVIAENIVFNQFGLGMQIYGSAAAWVRGYEVKGNVVFNNGSLWNTTNKVDNILIGGAQTHYKEDLLVADNFTYHTPSVNDGYSRIGLNWDEPAFNRNVIVRNNYWIGGENAVESWVWNTITFTGNTVYSDAANQVYLRTGTGQSTSNYVWNSNRYFGSNKFALNGSIKDFANWKTASGLDGNSTFQAGRPTGVWSSVRPNQYESGRGNIVIYNWNNQAAVSVDLSSVLSVGKRYEIRDVQNYFGSPVASGTYQGGSVSVPMNLTTIAPPVGSTPGRPSHTSSEFGVFVVVPLN